MKFSCYICFILVCFSNNVKGSNGNVCGDQDDFCNLYEEVLFDVENDPEYAETLPLLNVTNLEYEDYPTIPTTCPSFSDINSETPLNLRSLSPWIWVRNVDMNRIPQTIIESVCACAHCLDLHPDRIGNEDVRLVSVPITVKRPVLKRDSSGNWIRTIITSSVACRCDLA